MSWITILLRYVAQQLKRCFLIEVYCLNCLKACVPGLNFWVDVERVEAPVALGEQHRQAQNQQSARV